MCGIAGYVRLDGGTLDAGILPTLRNMSRQIAHRGPDDEQYWFDGPIGFAFRRLSIVDLAGGKQPMTNEDGSLVLMANGEIFNHQELRQTLRSGHHFRSQSDCEVILHLYEEKGVSFLDDLVGMYAIALWDDRERRLLLARDRLGKKPLFWSQNDTRLIFGSEIKALVTVPDCPRGIVWEEALAYPSLRTHVFPGREPTSFFKGIEHLAAGQALIVDARRGSIKKHIYWTPPEPTDEEYAADARSEEEIIAGYNAILREAIRIRLMADVELGVFLSGGIDSVAVSTVAAAYQKCHTFSALSQSTLGNGDAKAAHEAANHLGLPNHMVLFPWQTEIFTPERWLNLLWLVETPECGAEQLYKYELYRYAKAARPRLKVMLLGQGSDEFNGGYATVWTEPQPESRRNFAGFMDVMRELEWGTLFTRSGACLDPRSGGLSEPVLRPEFLASIAGQRVYRNPWFIHRDYYLYHLQMYNLWHEDRTAAGNHVENRVPFLDHRLIEYTLRIPPRHYQHLFWDKRILRQSFAKDLPPSLYNRQKAPFFFGVDERYTLKMLHRILNADHAALVAYAFEAAGGDHPAIDREAIERELKLAAEDPEHGSVLPLVRLVNIGLLDRMASQVPIREYTPEADAIRESFVVRDWDSALPELELLLGRKRTEITEKIVLAFSEGTHLVRSVQGASDGSIYYIVVGDRVRYVLEDSEAHSWLEVLRRIDGTKSLEVILQDLGLHEGVIRKHLEEALDYGVLTFDAGQPQVARPEGRAEG